MRTTLCAVVCLGTLAAGLSTSAPARANIVVNDNAGTALDDFLDTLGIQSFGDLFRDIARLTGHRSPGRLRSPRRGPRARSRRTSSSRRR